MTRGYRLALSGGLAWKIVADRGAADWLADFARILRLPECRIGNLPRLIVTRSLESALPVEACGWKARYVRFFQIPNATDITCVIGEKEDHLKEYYKMWDLLLPVYERVWQRGGMPFHAALLEKGGAGVVLSALGGTGKSTCARRVPPPWKALSDDECLVVRAGEAEYLVHALPTWSDYLLKRSAPVWDVGKAVRLAGIFFLRQSTRDEAVPLGVGEAALRAYDAGRQIFRYGPLTRAKDETQGGKTGLLDSTAGLVRRVPAYTLHFSRTGSFWGEIERVLSL